MRLVARAGARARGADEHIVLHLLAVLFAVRVLPDPGAVALDDLAVDRRLPRHGVLVISPVDLARLLVLAVVDHGVAGALGVAAVAAARVLVDVMVGNCLLYTSPSPRDGLLSRMPSSA